MSDLRLPLTKKWFDLTKAGIKTEDYREITPHWLRRLTLAPKIFEMYEGLTYDAAIDICNDIKSTGCIDIKLVHFNFNIMTLGYPKLNDSERILKLEHKGIEVREGNPDWGAIPGRKYFVIKHGILI